MTTKAKQDPVEPAPVEVEPAPVEVEPARPAGPSFGMCEGVRTDLEQSGKTRDPFTGETLTRKDLD